MSTIELTPTTGVIVTGAASGIGRACAAALAEAGRPVALWDRDAACTKEAEAEIAPRARVPVLGVAIDVTDAAAITPALERSRTTLGSIGGLVHAAGIVNPAPVAALDWASWAATLDVNLTAHARLVQALLADLRKNPGSAVVGISSIEAIVGHPSIPAYCASKAGLVGLTRSLAAELGRDGIRANAVCPGYIETPMTAPFLADTALRDRMIASSLLGRLGRPADVARAVRFLMSDEAAFITGTTLVVDGGVTATD